MSSIAYLDPPKRAVVFSFDEKSQIQALDRTQPGLPLKKGRAGTFTHDYKRHGTTTLFAALNVASGKIQHTCLPRHRRDEFLRFMGQLERRVPKGLGIHVILDNYATHKTPEVQQRLRRHPRVHFHFTPTSASWLNLVERFFSELTIRQRRRLAVPSVDELEAAIHQYIARRNADPQPFTWTASVKSILTKVKKANETLASLHSHVLNHCVKRFLGEGYLQPGLVDDFVEVIVFGFRRGGRGVSRVERRPSRQDQCDRRAVERDKLHG